MNSSLQNRASHKLVNKKPVATFPRKKLNYGRDIYFSILTIPGPCFVSGKPVYHGAVIRNLEPQTAKSIVQCFRPETAFFDAGKRTVTIYSEHVEATDELHTAINNTRGHLTKKMVHRIIAKYKAQESLHAQGLRPNFISLPVPNTYKTAKHRANPIVGSEYQLRSRSMLWLNDRMDWYVERDRSGTSLSTSFKPSGPVTVIANHPTNPNITISFRHQAPLGGINEKTITAEINRGTFINHFIPAAQHPPRAIMAFGQVNLGQNPVGQPRL
jgi:hypothetical protein